MRPTLITMELCFGQARGDLGGEVIITPRSEHISDGFGGPDVGEITMEKNDEWWKR